MDIFKYIDNYGMKTFEEYPFNEIDAVLFSFLSYVDFEEIFEKNRIPLKDVGRMHLGLHNKLERNITAVRDGTKLLKYIKDTKRYQDCILFNYEYDVTDDIQFSVISIEYQKNQVYVSFEGTNAYISGWKENLVLSYDYPTKSHLKAINYLDRHYTFSNKKLIVGGHSKGGNLALVSSMHANYLVRRRIKKIYNMDGPGLLRKQYNSRRFKSILPKYKHIIPNASIVGIILYNSNTEVVKSSVRGPLAHDILFWQIDKDKFIKGELETFSKELSIKIKDFIDNHTKEELRKSVSDINQVFLNAEIVELQDLNSIKNIKKVLDEGKHLDKDSKEFLTEVLNMVIKSFGSTIQTKLKEMKKIINNL